MLDPRKSVHNGIKGYLTWQFLKQTTHLLNSYKKNASQASSFPDNHQPNLAKKSAYTQPNTSQQGQAT